MASINKKIANNNNFKYKKSEILCQVFGVCEG